MFKFLLYLLFIYSQINPSLHYIIDYFSEEFDTYKNCHNKKQFLVQVKNNIDNYCNKYPVNEDNYDDMGNKFERCQKDLSQKLNIACGGKQVKKTGILSYCTTRGILYCCFSNHTCLDWYDVHRNSAKQAVNYLNNRTYYLQHYLIKDVGYKTCHHLKNYDATSCAEDCKLFGKGNFSKSCSKQSGVFKCCIRRDAVCDQCKFCCTLPMCTYKNNITIFDIPSNTNMTSSGRSYKNAKEIYSTDTLISTYYDYRCLKPDSDKNLEKWRHYDMPKFRAAVNKQDLSKVPAYKFHKLMFNHFDRNVLRKYHSSQGDKVAEKAYGFDYCAKVPMLNLTECSIQCIKAETSKFAKDCRKKKGLFKCCLTTFGIQEFEDVNIKNWAKMGLKKKPKRKCLKHNSFKDCWWCCLTYACTEVDIKTKKRITKFKTKLKPGKSVGGVREGVGVRFSFCINQDYCNTEFLIWETFVPQIKYHEAITSKDVCKLGTILIPNAFKLQTQSVHGHGDYEQRYELGDYEQRVNKSQCQECESKKYKQMTRNRERKCLENTKKSPFSNINVKTCSPRSLKKLKIKELKTINENLNKIKMEWKKVIKKVERKKGKNVKHLERVKIVVKERLKSIQNVQRMVKVKYLENVEMVVKVRIKSILNMQRMVKVRKRKTEKIKRKEKRNLLRETKIEGWESIHPLKLSTIPASSPLSLLIKIQQFRQSPHWLDIKI